ncbi:leucine rich repeat containing protein 48 [Echinococcus multilocularis]|uniref:Dynein regulatory complex subunit 3 n=1 Tax=Echinococcus multilocularis TaxID=6211 RepID=A0A068XXG0_ECHMU|nr:leucine rich repeat containing protein 48 [Echinococcus multilocularis]
MSRADTNLTSRKDFQHKISEFKKARDDRAYRVYGQLEPTVINEELLTYACFAEGPKGEAGRLAEIEGIAFDSVKTLTLSYQNILTIGGLNQFTSLTELRLDNNIVEKIEGLDMLVNLVRLDLSFNNLRKIENMENLVNLEDLSLFHNAIEKIENLDKNKKLRYLSLGSNSVEDLKNILYLRRFKKLDCLSLADNPISSHSEYDQYIFAFLPHLKYLDYKNILPEWRAEAYEKYQMAVDQMVEQQLEEERQDQKKEEERVFMEGCRAAFIDKIYGDALFKAIFEKDTDGRQLCQVPSIEELVEQYPFCTYKEKVIDACKQLFVSGQEEYQKRLEEEKALRNCISKAKEDSKARALTSIHAYEIKKNEILAKLDEIQMDALPVLTESLLCDLRQHIYDLWNDLMTNEIALVDQIEDVVNEFDRNLEEKVSSFCETVQVCFSKVRESALTFNERLAELTLTYTERIAKTDGPQDENYAIYADREFVVNALSNSKETHVNVIDLTEEGILKSIRSWFSELMDDIHEKEENTRHTNRVAEINLYIDSQRVDLETLDLALI